MKPLTDFVTKPSASKVDLLHAGFKVRITGSRYRENTGDAHFFETSVTRHRMDAFNFQIPLVGLPGPT
jgi:hypothetical protein